MPLDTYPPHGLRWGLMDTNSEKRFVTYCGVYCDACSWKRARVENDERHLSPRGKTLGSIQKQYWLSCPGCRVGTHRSDCEFRICAESRNLEHCVNCDEFPCKRHKNFNEDGVQHHANSLSSLNVLKNEGEEAWLEMQEKKWTCSCGTKLSWYLKSCLKCGKPVHQER